MGRRIASGMSRRASIPAAVSLTMIANVPRSARARRMPVARRKKEIEVPLFSGYCFVRFSQLEKTPIQKIVGVVEIVGSGSRPEPIPEEEINGLRRLMTSVLPYDSHPYLHEGMQVEVVRGPLQGAHGILLRKEKRHRLVVGVRLIQQAAAVEIDVNDVVAV